MCGAIPLILLFAFMALTVTNLRFHYTPRWRKRRKQEYFQRQPSPPLSDNSLSHDQLALLLYSAEMRILTI
jgi:hypothetical protein